MILRSVGRRSFRKVKYMKQLFHSFPCHDGKQLKIGHVFSQEIIWVKFIDKMKSLLDSTLLSTDINLSRV